MIGRRVSKGSLVLLASVALLLFTLLETWAQLHPWYIEKLEASGIMSSALNLIREEASRRGLEIDSRFDPNRTGLIGPEMSPIVTDEGLLDAKLIATNPNFAAVMVDFLKQAEVQRGDIIAVAYTGSMPGANIALLAACEAIGVRPLIISSVGASNWGATDPRFTWIDMEHFLVAKGIFRFGSLFVSFGGMADTANNLDDTGRRALAEAIRRSTAPLFYEKNLEKNIETRLKLYNEAAAGQPIKAFVNVGGGVASLGSQSNGFLIPPGFNRTLDLANLYPQGVIFEMGERGIPIIHVLNLAQIVDAYGLPRYPVPMPRVGEGKVFYLGRYNLTLILGLTALLLLLILVVVEVDLRFAPEIESFLRRKFTFRKGENP